jgi:hypothetical protein
LYDPAAGAATTTSLSSATNPSTLGQSVTFTATVTGQSPTGTVTFKEGATTICSPVTLSANYAGDAANAASTSVAIMVSVLKASDVVFRNALELDLASCPIE